MSRVYKFLTALAIVLALFLALFAVAKRWTTPVVVQRVLHAAPERVWANWTNPDQMTRWWGPRDYTAPTIKNDVRVNGLYLFSMRSPEGQTSWNAGHYLEVVQLHRLVATMSFADSQGHEVPASTYGVPGNWPPETMWRVDFTDLGRDQTQVTVTETGVPTLMYAFTKLSWEQQFDKFEAMLQ